MSTKLRYLEYHGIQKIFDSLYWRSQNNITHGIDLLGIITSEANIMLAYRTIKSNKGSKTAGVDDVTINDFKDMDKSTFINLIKETIGNFTPAPVRRVEIPKENGETRPLGIPTILDRIIGQMILQVLTPICEAKFYKHSYGFRENRSTHHALARCYHLINRNNCHYVVLVFINGFFDNVNHAKLLSQLYTIGVKDRRVLAIIGKMLKAKIVGVGIPTKGTPQGHIISPLLSNVVLNDLDHWISKQWENIETKHDYKTYRASRIDFSNKYKALRKSTQLKEMYIVRYADDFKIFTKSHKEAWKIFYAVKGYLQHHLKLDISPEKSQVTNLRRRSSEFLGIEMKATKKNKKYVVKSNISKSNKRKIRQEILNNLKAIQKSPTVKTVSQYNSYLLGIHNYYSVATRISKDFADIGYSLLYTRFNRLKSISSHGVPRSPPLYYKRHYGNNYKTYKISGIYLFPIEDVKHKRTYGFNQNRCNYTKIGRQVHQILNPNVSYQIQRLLNQSSIHTNIEYLDNRLSRYSMQNGKCAITGYFLEADEVHCHHILPKHLGGNDTFSNLSIVHIWVHRLIHATDAQTIKRYKQLLKLTNKQLEKLNKYREKCNLTLIY